ncbi:MAG: PKD domain-containing protein, partial [Bacteroidales bacterium]|nr:PKD domain-containing protein [Bacteroidales bacterium]
LKNNNTISVAIIDLDGNYNSGPEMQTAIEANGISVEYMTGFPADLSAYTSVFVCLGIFSYNHILTSFEGQLLADYLNNGGNLYMEGGDTWFYDQPTAVHSMFNIFPEADGANNLGTINGMTGTFTEGMSFNYSGENSWIDQISAISPAFDILENQSPNYGTGVAYDEGSYRTIGTSHEFGGLDDGTSPTTKEELMAEYLNFFGIPTSLQALFGSNTTSVCEGQTVDFYNQSSGVVISWEWEFEGGAPGSSSFPNPTVMYFNEGTYDVTLTVSDGVDSNTLTIEDYITVNSCTNVEEDFVQLGINIFPNPSNGRLTVKFNNNIGQIQITVLNILNEVLFESSTETVNGNIVNFDLSNYAKGVYFVRIKTANSEQVRKIVIR